MRYLSVLVLAGLTTVLSACSSSSDPDDGGGNNATGGNMGRVTFGSTYTYDSYETDASYTDVLNYLNDMVYTVDDTSANYEGKTKVIVLSNDASSRKEYQVAELNGDLSVYASMESGLDEKLAFRWVRMPLSGTGSSTTTIDTTATIDGMTLHFTGDWKVTAAGSATITEAGKEWSVRKVNEVKTLNFTVMSKPTMMRFTTTYYYSPDLLQAVRTEIKQEVTGITTRTFYELIRLRSYDKK